MRYLKLSILYAGMFLMFTMAYNTTEVKQYQILKSKPTKLELYMKDIAHWESGGKQKIKNEFGMLGLYQFSRTTLKSLGYTRSASEFLNNKHLQDTMMVKNLQTNYEILKPYIKRYNNKTFKGVRITTAGVLAAAHLGGPGSVMEWFKNDSHTGLVDANGTSIRKYMVEFGEHGHVMGEL